MATRGPGVFLTAEWRHLAMLNYEIDPAVLAPWVPRGTALDLWDGRTLVSVVGFRFLKTRVLGLAIPFHRDFEEVNLRFYVRRRHPEGDRRGVVFVREIVPRLAVAMVANLIYHERYVALPTRSRIALAPGRGGSVEYGWRLSGRWNGLSVGCAGDPAPLVPGSEAEFITEHYWGYAAQADGGTVEYRVEHPPWRVWPAIGPALDCDVERLYGPQFTEALSRPPASAFLAEGSPVVVRRGARI